jgi:hypothetical protein
MEFIPFANILITFISIETDLSCFILAKIRLSKNNCENRFMRKTDY